MAPPAPAPAQAQAQAQALGDPSLRLGMRTLSRKQLCLRGNISAGWQGEDTHGRAPGTGSGLPGPALPDRSNVLAAIKTCCFVLACQQTVG